MSAGVMDRVSEPSRIADTSWIRPGKVAWDWWNDWGITGVDFEAGINTRTYMHYIDFAARKGLEYVILDEGWAKDNGDILDINPAIDLDAIIKYAESKGVSIILWATWRQLKDDCPALMKRFADMRDGSERRMARSRSGNCVSLSTTATTRHGSTARPEVRAMWPADETGTRFRRLKPPTRTEAGTGANAPHRAFPSAERRRNMPG